MKPSFKQRFWSTGVIVILTVVLATLAVLQYKWSGEISEATLLRMRQNLQSSVVSFREGLYQDFESIVRGLRLSRVLTTADDRSEFATQISAWRRTATHPWLVENIYLWQKNADGSFQSWRLDPADNTFKSGEIPAKLSRLEMALESMPREIFFERRMPREVMRGPSHEIAERERVRFAPVPPWMMVDAVPAIVGPVIASLDPAQRSKGRVQGEWVVVELSLKAVQQHILPELAERYFGTPAESIYNVTVTASELGPVLYSSTTKTSDQDPLASPDATINLFGPMGGGFHVEPGPQSRAQGPERFGEHHARPLLMRFDLLAGTPGGDGWRLVVKHRDGSLEEAVGALRRRNLIVSFAVLLVLAVTTGMVVIFTNRAQRLARLQMEFVTSVSHELRTPLTVISSAADNIADGIVDNKQQLVRYGMVIKTQAKQLAGLVEQILLFASTSDKRSHYQMRQMPVMAVVDAAMKSSAGLLQAEGIVVDQEFDADLPEVSGDLNALCQCLQNLIVNAVKYRSSENWLKVSAKRAGDEVHISIEDHGKGIAPSDLPHIFEPFYRGREVSEAQVHGTGLGLPIAKNIAESMGGRLSVKTKLGEGSVFTLHLPVATEADSAAEMIRDRAPQPNMEHKIDA